MGRFAFTGRWAEETYFVNDARKVFDNGLAIELIGFCNAHEGKVSAAEEFFHVFGVATWGMVGIGSVIDFNGADGTKCTFVAKDKVDGFIFDVTVSFMTILIADFVAKEGGQADVRNNIEFLAENVVEDLEAMFFGASHKLFLRAITEAIHSIATVALGDENDKDGNYQKSESSDTSDSDKNFVHM